MLKTITKDIFIAFSQCQRKAFLLQFRNERGSVHEYEQIVKKRKKDNQRKYINSIKKKGKNAVQYTIEEFEKGNFHLIDPSLKFNGLVADFGLLERVQNYKGSNYIPIIFIGTQSITKESKLELFFSGYVLGQVQNRVCEVGRIIKLDQKKSTLKTRDSFQSIKPFLDQLSRWNINPNLEPPPLILNNHCACCQFKSKCLDEAEENDNLSLLDKVSTYKLIKKFERKGIFTVNQLSYLYRPRRKRKRSRHPPSLKHSLELQALVLRTGKIYIKETPQVTRCYVELFLDIEGVPDQQFYYLIGVLVCRGNDIYYHSFWADKLQDEEKIWIKLINLLRKHKSCPIYHYGSYEAKAIIKLGKRYNTETEKIADRLVNLNTFIYGKVYFPLRSNNLKEIGKFIGASWTLPEASGLQSIVWRHYWDDKRELKYKNRLIVYNKEDCLAIKTLTDFLTSIEERENTLLDIDRYVFSKKSRSSKSDNPLHCHLETILKFAHRDYNRNKIRFREENDAEAKLTPTTKKIKTRKKKYRRVTRKIQASQVLKCRKCGNKNLSKSKNKTQKTVIDLIFTKNGVRKSVIKYWAHDAYCRKCKSYTKSPDLSRRGRFTVFGYGFKIWIAYQRIALRLSYRSIAMITDELFNERFSVSMIIEYFQEVARNYVQTEKWIIKKLKTSPFLHVDETTINVDNVNQYIWVFTDGRYVIFKHTETREASFVQDFLVDYEGILISDFYSGYDSLNCRHQKCLVHLIRDLNNDLYSNPFDIELEKFIHEFRNLILPIMEDVQRYGLKKRHLNKFKKSVTRFYVKSIEKKTYKSDLCLKYQKRLKRFEDSLFTFLEGDNIPWHNNTAENALTHIILQENISRIFHRTVIQEFLILLGIRQSCKFHNKSFLNYLLSGQTISEYFSN